MFLRVRQWTTELFYVAGGIALHVSLTAALTLVAPHCGQPREDLGPVEIASSEITRLLRLGLEPRTAGH